MRKHKELDGTKCSDYPVVKDNSATYVCIDNIDTSTGTNKVGQPCKEEQLCTEVIADGDNCLSYPVPLDDREEQGCGKPTAEGNCIQVSLCNKATKSGTLACSDFPLTWENINTHKCINGETDTSCKEVPYCNFATPDSEKDVMVFLHKESILLVIKNLKVNAKKNRKHKIQTLILSAQHRLQLIVMQLVKH